MSKDLFEEFSPITQKEWLQQISKDLKGADFDEKLIWHSDEGLGIKPFYTSEDSKTEAPVIFSHTQWQHVVEIFVEDAKSANAFALKALEKGATGLHFIITSEIDVNTLFEGILFEYIFCVIEVQDKSRILVDKVNAFIQNYKPAIPIQQLYVILGPINLMELEIEAIQPLDTNVLSDLENNFFTLKINASPYANAGATQTQQLAFALAHLNAYLSLPNAVEALQGKALIIELAVGSNYFFEIAKHRALRQLVLFLLDNYGIKAELIVLSKTAYYNKSAADSYSNLLRTSTEAMSAIIGGCNALVVGRFDCVTLEKQEQAVWWALNQSLILEHESYFNHIADVAAGSYYIEHLSFSFCDLAWQVFQGIEAEGGWLKYLESGEAERNVQEACSQILHHYQSKAKGMIGVNQFVNTAENYKPDYNTTLKGKFKPFNIAQSINP